VNCLGAYALTKLLTPTIVSTAKDSPPGSVRVVWVSLSAAKSFSPKNYLQNVERTETLAALDTYGLSKLSNYLHGVEFANRHRADGVLSVPLNPGALDSELWREQSALTTAFLRATFAASHRIQRVHVPVCRHLARDHAQKLGNLWLILPVP
jgi:hypothetical protein